MKPIIVLSNVEHSCATFLWPHNLDYYVGYRFVEQEPKITTEPLPHPTSQISQPPPATDDEYPRGENWLDNWQTAYDDSKNLHGLRFQTLADGSAIVRLLENNGQQEKSWRFVPEQDGVRCWMTLKTEQNITGGYILQQCLRLTSGIGYGFYPTIARVPFLSELYMQALGNANGTLTWGRKDNAWFQFPLPFTRYHLPLSEGVYNDSRGQVDYGLIVRETAPRGEAPASYWQATAPEATWETWTAGFYWQRAVYISNRHPADCLHIGVDFGPLEAGESRTVEGKFYWLEGTKDDLLNLWWKNFEERED